MHASQSRETPADAISHAAVQIPVRLIESHTPTDAAGVRALFDSILQWGILQPLIVRRVPGNTRYELLAGAKRLASAASAGFSEVPCVVFEGPDADAAAIAAASNISAAPPPQTTPASAPPPTPFITPILSELQATRSAIAGSLRLAPGTGAGLRPRIARELVDIELHRESWILDGLQILTSDDRGIRTSIRLGPVLRSITDAFQPECRLAGIDMQLLVEPADLLVVADEADVRTAMNCAIGALLTRMHDEPRADATLSLLATGSATAVVVSMSQNVVSFQELVRLRSSARRGEVPYGDSVLSRFAFECARRAVERLGGRLELRPETSTPGGTIELKFAAALPATD